MTSLHLNAATHARPKEDTLKLSDQPNQYRCYFCGWVRMLLGDGGRLQGGWSLGSTGEDRETEPGPGQQDVEQEKLSTQYCHRRENEF